MLSYKPRLKPTENGFWFDEVPVDFHLIQNPNSSDVPKSEAKMSNDSLNRWVFKIPVDVFTSSTGDATTEGGCYLCGKKIKSPQYSVHLLNTGHLVSSDQPFDDSQGFFLIGNECRKRLPNNFVFKNDAN